MFRLSLYLPVLFIILPVAQYAQEFEVSHTHPTVEALEFSKEGQLGRNQLFQFQDSRGFIWGSEQMRQLMRFDGNRIEIFPSDPDDPATPSQGTLLDINSSFFEDSRGKIWIDYTEGYLDRYDPLAESFERFHPRLQEAAGKGAGWVRKIFEDHRKRIWIGTDYGLFQYDPSIDSVFAFPFPAPVTLVFEDTENHLWAHIQYQDLVRINPETGEIEERVAYPDTLKPERIDIWGSGYTDFQIALKNRGTHLLAVRGWLYEFDPHDRTIVSRHQKPLSRNALIYFLSEKDGRILATCQGDYLIQYFPDEQRLVEPPQLAPGGKGEKIGFRGMLTILQTDDDIIWVNGLQYDDGRGQNVRLLPKKLAISDYEIPNNIYNTNINSRPGDYCFFFNNKPWFFTRPWLTPLFSESVKNKRINLSIPGVSDHPDLTYQFTTDANGHLWQVATPKYERNGRLYIREFDPNGNLVKTHAYFGPEEINHPSFAEKRDQFPGGIVNDAKFDQEGKLWIGMDTGLLGYDPAEETFLNLGKTFEENGTGNLTCLWIDEKDNIWCGTWAGVAKYDQKTGALTLYSNPERKLRVSNLAVDSSGIIWVGTPTGLLSLDRETGQFIRYGKEKNFTGKRVESIFVDHFQQLWVISEDIFFLYNQECDCFFSFGLAEGVSPNQLDVKNAHAINEEGTVLLLSSSVSVYLFQPEKIQLASKAPDVYFTDFQLFNKKVTVGGQDGILSQALDFTNQVQLEFSQNDFTIHFTAPEYARPDELEFSVRMPGFNDEWQNVGNKREARYTNLSPGQYTFQVKVRNHLGAESETPRSLSITILPPWYRTTWAYTLWIALITGSIYAIYRYQLRRRLAIAEAAQLKELDQAKTRLYTNITHEFRTPLTVILGMTEQVKSDPKNWFNEGLRLIGRNGKHLLYLVNQLLDLSKLESGSMPLNLVHGDVISYLHYLTESFYSYADSKDIRLHFRSNISEIEIDYDPEKLQHVMSNLLSNAIKFTQAGGDVYVELDVKHVQEKAFLQWKVEDTGYGIAPEHLSHIFDRFYQADASATRRGEGTGIGLALTKELVKVMGGEIDVESTVGKGTKFNIQLPITHTAQSQPARVPEPSEALLETALFEEEETPAVQPVEPSDRYTVLLVEDNQDVITYLSSILSLYYQVITARNGKEGIDKAMELTPDLIVSDVMMPDTDGFELCQTLKTDERTSHIPIILLTAKADQTAKVEGLSYGADAYLTKPFHKEELLVRVEKLIEQRRKLQEKYQKAGSLRSLLKVIPDSFDETFLQKVVRIIETEMSDEEFGLPRLCKALQMDRSNLFRKLKALTGKSATDLIRVLRLEKARELLERTEMTVSEVCYAVGFNNTSYFSRVFKEHHGIAPSEVRKT